MMDSKKSNKITDIVRLQQILKKRKTAANASSKNTSPSASTTSGGSGSKGIKFLKRTLSFTDFSSSRESDIVPKGFLAVCVGKELKRFVIPTEYLRRQAFDMLLREAEEQFGFQREGVLKFPCHVSLFEKILKVVEHNKKEDLLSLQEIGISEERDKIRRYASDCEITPTHHAQMCR